MIRLSSMSAICEKKVGSFAILANPHTQNDFMNDLTKMVKDAPFQACVIIIDKKRLVQKYNDPWNPYHISLQICMERLKTFFYRESQLENLAHVVFESRGKNEDNELELEFRRISDNRGRLGNRVSDFSRLRVEPIFARKDANAAGLQLADLVARPYGMRFFRPNQVNRTHDVLAAKLINDINGLTILPELP
jgi:hypothetical protein